jgi:hypothetical protein
MPTESECLGAGWKKLGIQKLLGGSHIIFEDIPS